MKIKISALSDVGKERDNNEDAYAFCQDLANPNWKQNKTYTYSFIGDYGSLLVVADGMGGANAGEVASSIAVNTVRRSFSARRIEDALTSEDKMKLFLNSVIRESDNTIKHKMSENIGTMGMGTTIVLCWIIKDKAYVAWCGDSRCYVYNPITGLRCITKDHSYVQELIDQGKISAEEAFAHPDSNIITRGLGDFDTPAEPDIVVSNIVPNDIIMLCSDGLCGYCKDGEIERVMYRNYTDTSQCLDALLELALNAGGYDNICIELASVIGNDQKMPDYLSVWQRILLRLKRILG